MENTIYGTVSLLLFHYVVVQGCPRACSCNETIVTCRNDEELRYIPKLPDDATGLIFSGNYLPFIERHTMSNLTRLKLTVLVLRYNHIRNISKDALSELKFLEKIDLTGNKNLTIHQVADTLRGIHSAYLHTVIINSFYWRKDLSIIYQAVSVPQFKIKTLISEGNTLNILNFTSLNRHLPKLEHLSVKFNSIQIFITDHALSLKRLYLDYNYIELKENMFGTPNDCFFPNLEILQMKSNFLIYFENRFSCLDNVHTLKIGRNPVKRILNNTFYNLTSLRTLSISNTGGRLYKIESLAFRSDTIQSLNFSANYFPFISESAERFYFNPDEILNHLPNLEVLDLSENKFNVTNNVLFRMLIPLKNLQHLTIRHCALTTIPKNLIFRLEKLRYLDLSQNHIKTWKGKTVFKNVSSIEILRLDMNYITVFKESLFPAVFRRNLRSIYLANNPFSCTCKLLWLRKWIEDKSEIFKQYPEHYICSTPIELHGSLLKSYFPSDRECESINELLIAFTVLSTIGIFVVMLASLVYKGRWHIRHAIYLFHIRQKGYEGMDDVSNFLYSGFVVYCDEDREWVKDKFIKMVEINDRKLCIHHRDFVGGKLIIDNIANGIARSKKVILILSRAMIKSDWCLFEMRLAHKKFIKRADSLLIIMLETVSPDDMPKSLHTLLTISTYIRWSSDLVAEEEFWKKVRRAIK
ncbi:toll-like receptor 6 [Mytilus californianus]|uniref:toll-like receptor 6 n=1 Tax=Mytilus californianus TaxID=6549 RepID=UPI002247E3B7|nr:toll-like receptor 6 [Mytilus californianus]